ncbi:MAG: sigma-54-dependent Fis family transcriptional regulator, partial [Proteobacteria bacterium]|nr:sigma-54-dependent Fis family transcriptional regulator [Pseudomonadota bacterium]
DGISPQSKDLLLKYDYPGNVRELENILERAVVITRESVISDADLPFSFNSPHADQGGIMPRGTMKESVEALERQMIKKAMQETSNHQTRAAGLLGISERMLRYKLKKYDLK